MVIDRSCYSLPIKFRPWQSWNIKASSFSDTAGSRRKLSGLGPDRRGHSLGDVLPDPDPLWPNRRSFYPQPDSAGNRRILAVSDEAAMDRFVPNEGVVELMFILLLGLQHNPSKEAWDNFATGSVVGIKVLVNQAD